MSLNRSTSVKSLSSSVPRTSALQGAFGLAGDRVRIKPVTRDGFYLVMSGKVTKCPAFMAALKQSAPTVSIQRIGT